MKREVVKVQDFNKIAKENEFFIWHFLQKNQEKTTLGLKSYFLEPREGELNPIKYIFDRVSIPYFESYTEESIDFLMDFNFSGESLYTPRFEPNFYFPRETFYKPLILAFNKFKLVDSTNELCYCPDSIIKMILSLNPKFIEGVEFD